ncbi:hypothetical protein AVEN_71646-1 [Araneus ventricosus]|uniref:Uncharacterized protein n=1 Tax=Araneus ventricosus TaxID=182803 RepID=A0A4Y2JEG8_ARAVE|nr:hypothetical protein AVEN_71646-1 [Araneus ventricosus]
MKYDSSRLVVNHTCAGGSVGEGKKRLGVAVRLEKPGWGAEGATQKSPVLGRRECGWESVWREEECVCVGGGAYFGTTVNDLPKSNDWNEWNINQLLVQIDDS